MISRNLSYMYLVVVLLLGVSALNGQDSGTGSLSARQLYFKPKATTPAPSATVAKPATRPASTKPKPRPETAPQDVTISQPAPEAPPQFRVQSHDLGLRYAIVQAGPDRRMTDEVDPEKEFVSGERFALRLESNDDAFLYVYSDTTGEMLFPNAAEANKIRAGTPVIIPGRCANGEMDDCFQFDNAPGTERLMVVLSSAPEPDLERVLKGMSGQKRDAAPKLLATNMSRMKDEMKLESRGIVRGSTRKAAGGEENAVYIVQTGAAARPRVITEIVLRHK